MTATDQETAAPAVGTDVPSDPQAAAATTEPVTAAATETETETTESADERLAPPIESRPRHRRDTFYIVGEGVWGVDSRGQGSCRPPTTDEDLRAFRFSRLGPEGPTTPRAVLQAVAEAMTDKAAPQPDSGGIPAGFTYLGQFVDHDLTSDRTKAALGDDVTVAELVQGRSPALDLDSLYGRGPTREPRAYAPDGIHLAQGATLGVGFPPDDPVAANPLDGFDLPRAGSSAGGTLADQRAPLIPDARNDENLIVAQTHGAFIRFHNRVVDELAPSTPSFLLFEHARRDVVLHYQWMLRTDFLPRIVDPAIVDDVFTHGRRFFDAPHHHRRSYRFRPRRPLDTPTMPVEFSVAAYRLGHSMVRGAYQWNRVFESGGPGGIAMLLLLFTFTGVSGNFQPGSSRDDLDNPQSGAATQLPTNWIADFRRLYDFGPLGRDELVVTPQRRNLAKRIDTRVVDPLSDLPAGTFNGRGTNPPAIERNLAFRNLLRANMVRLATGQQMAQELGVTPLTPEQVLTGGDGGVDLTQVAALSDADRTTFAQSTPLWFYVLREAELNGGVLTGVGGRIVAEVFHRAMEGSCHSIVRNPAWRPRLGPDRATFRMIDLLAFAFEGRADLLNPLGDPAPAPAPTPGGTPEPVSPSTP